MVATRSKTRTSTGGDEHQPKIDDALEEVSTGRKRRTSKATKADGDAVANKKEPKTKKRKTEETAGEAHDQNEGQDDEKEVSIEAKDTAAGGAVEEKSETAAQPESTDAEKDVEMDEKDQEQHVEKVEKEQGQGAAIDSSRVDLEPNADKEEKDVDAANGQAETATEKEAEEEKATGATDKQQVEEAEKEIVQNDNVTEYGTIHFLYKPKVCTKPSHQSRRIPSSSEADSSSRPHRSKSFTQAQSMMSSDCTSFSNPTSKMILLGNRFSRECSTSVAKCCLQRVKVDDSRKLCTLMPMSTRLMVGFLHLLPSV